MWTIAGCGVVFAFLKYWGFQLLAIGLAAIFGAVTGNLIAWIRWRKRTAANRRRTTDD